MAEFDRPIAIDTPVQTRSGCPVTLYAVDIGPLYNGKTIIGSFVTSGDGELMSGTWRSDGRYFSDGRDGPLDLIPLKKEPEPPMGPREAPRPKGPESGGSRGDALASSMTVRERMAMYSMPRGEECDGYTSPNDMAADAVERTDALIAVLALKAPADVQP